jgi:putative NADH-flavin reductase
MKLIEEWYERTALKRVETVLDDVSMATAAVARLDGRRRSLLSLVDEAEPRVLLIGGGADGWYVAQLLVNIDQDCSRLVRAVSEPGERRRLVVGGQASWFRADECCTRAEIQSAVEAFIERRHLNENLRWEKVG